MINEIKMVDGGMQMSTKNGEIVFDWQDLNMIREFILKDEIRNSIDYIINRNDWEEFVEECDYDDWLDDFYYKLENWDDYFEDELEEKIYETLEERGAEF